jgi:hypothetical protein
MEGVAMNQESREPSFCEVVVEGNFERSHGLLLGLHLGSGLPGRMFFSHEDGVRASFGERLREVVGLHAPICHVVVDEPARQLLERHAEAIEKRGVRVAQTRTIRGARFAFSYHAYAPQYAQQIRDLLRGLPVEAKLDGGEPHERLDLAAHATEAYAPAHQYECTGEGVISGRIDQVIAARRSLAGHPLVKADRIQLEVD